MKNLKDIIDKHQEEYKKMFNHLNDEKQKDQSTILQLLNKIKELEVENSHLKNKLKSIEKIIKL